MTNIRSAYVHVPFCHHRCGYCNFTLMAGRPDLIPEFLSGLEVELRQTLLEPQTIDTLYFGGGTPSFLPTEDLERLLSLVTAWLRPSEHSEISFEMNPLDCTPEKLKLLKSAGVKRISLGGQSFSNRKLRILERDHTGSQLRQAIECCLQHIENVSLDLIFAVPEETLSEWRHDVQAATEQPVKHLSTYGLTIERGAAFYGRSLRHEIQELDADVQLQLFQHVIDVLTDSGWEHYEVSSFARADFRCQHNENYWLGRPWWAFGPGAASFLPVGTQAEKIDGDGSGELRQPLDIRSTAPTHYRNVNHRSTTFYIRALKEGRSPVAEQDPITAEQYIRERLVFGLRRLQGINLDELSAECQCDVGSLFQPFLDRYLERGWLSLSQDGTLRLTPSGLMISDSLWPDLL